MQKQLKVFEDLQRITSLIPTPIYWLDLNSIVLGMNKACAKNIGMDIIGKTARDLYPKTVADHIIQHNEKVIRTKEVLTQEEMIQDTTGKIKYFMTTKSPICDDNGNTIGIVGIFIDITAQKEAEGLLKKAKILEHLEVVASILPAPIYWEDVNSVILGGNEPVLKATGALIREAYVGKTLFELYPPEMANHIKQHNEEVMRQGKILSQEELIADIKTGEVKYFTAIKAPLYDDDGKVIGIVGTSVDITAEKEAERLKLENEVHKNLAKEQEKFVNIANQVAHDIRSPLASLLMIVKSCTEIPEEDRIALREAAIGIGDIANHLLNQYQKKESDSETEERKPILVSATLLQLLTDKKYQYQSLSIKLNHNFSEGSHFSFIKIEPTAFKRMISNLINNSVDAFDDKKGRVDLKLDADPEWVRVIIQDDGKGMPPEVVDKIMNNIAVTAGKKTGHGIGLTQVREALQRNQGELLIDSKLGQGTQITLTFPRTKTPHWIAEEIALGKQDILIILDDDVSIHRAWDTRFEPILKKAPDMHLKHFTIGNDALAFINALSPAEKKRVFLLTDYELLKQELNGLHVVEKTEIQRSILVTSHYANQLIRAQAAKTGTKILPKQLSSEVPIKIDDTLKYETSEDTLKKVDVIVVDDDELFVKMLTFFIFDGQSVAQYHDPYHFLKQVSQYPKNTPIYLDNNFSTSKIKGIDIAKQLHEQGYTRLCILSGENFKTDEIPSYVTVIGKEDTDGIKNFAQALE